MLSRDCQKWWVKGASLSRLLGGSLDSQRPGDVLSRWSQTHCTPALPLRKLVSSAHSCPGCTSVCCTSCIESVGVSLCRRCLGCACKSETGAGDCRSVRQHLTTIQYRIARLPIVHPQNRLLNRPCICQIEWNGDILEVSYMLLTILTSLH